MAEDEALESALKKVITQEKSDWGYIENFDVDENWAVRTAIEQVQQYRKTFASREYRRTKDILFVSKRLGHASTDVTIKYYICDDIELDRMQANIAA